MNRDAIFNIIDDEYDNDLILDAIEAIVLDSGFLIFMKLKFDHSVSAILGRKTALNLS